jgi:DNA-binding MarR family transcriptional regulator
MDADEAARAFAGQFPAVYRRFCRQLAPTQYRPTAESLAILQHLADAGPLTVTEAARHMRRSQAAMSELLQRLVGRGLLARLPDERDRRRTLVWLTPAGQHVLDDAKRVLAEDLLAAALQQMTPRQRGALIRSVQALLDTRARPGDKQR